MKNIFKLLADFISPDKSKFKTIDYQHGDRYKKYFSNPVAAEKQVLLTRGIDPFNVGHTTRAAEIKELIAHELRNASPQQNSHLAEYTKQFDKAMETLAAKKAEKERLEKGIKAINEAIAAIESKLDSETEDTEDEDISEED